MRRLVFGIVIATASFVAGEELPFATPESVGVSKERLARIAGVFAESVERREVPGYVTLVARKGKIVHWEAYGHRRADTTEPMPKNAIFEMASMTKPITVVSALMLYEEGRILMHEPLSKYLPEFKSPMVQVGPGEMVPIEREITPHDLFTHTSGIKDPRTRIEKYTYPTLADYMSDLAQEPLKFQPGSRWLYGDSHDVLGYLVEVVSGQRLDRFWQSRIFDPLGMSDSHFWLPSEKEARRAVLLRDGVSDPQMTARYPAIAGERKTFVAGAGGLHMTALDYWRFCQMLLDGGVFNGVQLLSPKTIEWMVANHIGDLQLPFPGLRFGLGLAVVADQSGSPTSASLGTYFWGGALGTFFWIDPEEELIGIFMAQVVPNQYLHNREKFMALVYSSLVD